MNALEWVDQFLWSKFCWNIQKLGIFSLGYGIDHVYLDVCNTLQLNSWTSTVTFKIPPSHHTINDMLQRHEPGTSHNLFCQPDVKYTEFHQNKIGCSFSRRSRESSTTPFDPSVLAKAMRAIQFFIETKGVRQASLA